MGYTSNYKVSGGLIRGEIIDNVCVFKGVPYAGNPGGSKRFLPAPKVEPWEGVKDCTSFGLSPVQKDLSHLYDDLWTKEFIISEKDRSEDCLTLNLWAPKDTKNCPVVLYFYGGGFTGGGSSCEIYDGTSFAENGVIYVTFNHRVATLSLFTHPSIAEKSPTKHTGNCNLYDAISALNWIKENIAEFGGDPSNVAIWGQSSGAAEVMALSISPVTKGLFNKAIAMGYNCYTKFARPWSYLDEAIKASNELLDENNMDIDTFVNESEEFFKDVRDLTKLVVDEYIVPDIYADAIDKGLSSEIPLLIGAVTGDFMMGSIFSDAKPDSKEKMLEPMKAFFKDDYERVLELYDIENKDYTAAMKEINIDNIIAGQLFLKEARKAFGANAATYTYFLDYPMPGPMSAIFEAFHSSEVPYFNNYFSPLRKDYWTEKDYSFGEKLNDEICKFIKDGALSDEMWAEGKALEYTHLYPEKCESVEFSAEKYEIWKRGYKNQTEYYYAGKQ